MKLSNDDIGHLKKSMLKHIKVGQPPSVWFFFCPPLKEFTRIPLRSSYSLINIESDGFIKWH